VSICGIIKEMKEKIILIGGGGHCKSVIDVIELEERLVKVPSGILSTDSHK